ncbi:MAG: hypothetical protein J0L92_04695 [Deltaproteobacteria bacterium]|nr:hypothetical protein [Deltaproteobacteria bacterium]
MDRKRFEELLLQSLTHEKGGVNVYRAALRCALEPDLQKEWSAYLTQTRRHVTVLRAVCATFGIDPDAPLPCCKPAEHAGRALVEAMELGLRMGDPVGAQLVACDCVVLAETKDHANWQLLSELIPELAGAERRALAEAVEEVGLEERAHIESARGWARALWLDTLGVSSSPPPPDDGTRRVTPALRPPEPEGAMAMKA